MTQHCSRVDQNFIDLLVSGSKPQELLLSSACSRAAHWFVDGDHNYMNIDHFFAHVNSASFQLCFFFQKSLHQDLFIPSIESRLKLPSSAFLTATRKDRQGLDNTFEKQALSSVQVFFHQGSERQGIGQKRIQLNHDPGRWALLLVACMKRATSRGGGLLRGREHRRKRKVRWWVQTMKSNQKKAQRKVGGLDP